MKQLVITVGAMAAFSLFETTLLIGSMTTSFSHPYTCWYRGLVWWGQWILISVSAAVMHALFLALMVGLAGLYGCSRWDAGDCHVDHGSYACAGGVRMDFYDSLDVDTPIVVLSSLVVLAVAGVAVAVSFPIKRAARRSLEREAQRWLVERQQCPDAARRLHQRRGRRLTAWVPTLTVLLVSSSSLKLGGPYLMSGIPDTAKFLAFVFLHPRLGSFWTARVSATVAQG